MNPDQPTTLMSPVMQAGFAGLTVILLTFMVFLVRWILTKLIGVLQEVAHALKEVVTGQAKVLELINEVRDWMLKSGKGD